MVDKKKSAYVIYEWSLSDHLPVGCKKICLSFSAEGPSKASDLVPETDEPICLVIGAIAKGKYFGGFYNNENIYIYRVSPKIFDWA